MVKYIAHRGNTQGPQPSFENTIEYLRSAYQDYDVEIDLIGHKGTLCLGHDEPQQPAPLDFVQSEGVWCHAKNYETLNVLTKIDCHYFWHQEDDYTITSKGYIWVYPRKPPIDNSISVLPEDFKINTSKCFGICTDHLNRYIDIK